MSTEQKFILPPLSNEALDELPFGVYVVDSKGVVEFFNKKMAEISGVQTAQKIEGQNLLEIPNYKKYGLDKYIQKGLMGEPFKAENIEYVSFVGKRASIRSFWGIPVKDEAGKVIKLFCIINDVTQEVKNQKKIAVNLKEKEALLEELHHRVKNNMQIIYQLFNTQASNVKDKESLELIKESQDQIKSMLMIHENLYQSKNLAGINLKRQINDIISNLYNVYKRTEQEIGCDVEVTSAQMSVDKAIPCAQIINELVSNSFRHAFPLGAKGKIGVKLSSAGNNYELIVSDNGRGVDGEKALNELRSIGLETVNTLVNQINGRMSTVSESGKGTKMIIKFPKELPKSYEDKG